jgi:hypothetical protein
MADEISKHEEGHGPGGATPGQPAIRKSWGTDLRWMGEGKGVATDTDGYCPERGVRSRSGDGQTMCTHSPHSTLLTGCKFVLCDIAIPICWLRWKEQRAGRGVGWDFWEKDRGSLLGLGGIWYLRSVNGRRDERCNSSFSRIKKNFE